MKIMKKIFCIVTIISAFMLISQSVCADSCINSSKPYDYPIRPGTEQWASFTTHKQMVDACQIPDEVLNNMSTEDLLKSILDYPLFFDMITFDNLYEGFDAVRSNFKAIDEFYLRADCEEALLAYYELEQENANMQVVSDMDEFDEKLDHLYLDMLTAQTNISTTLKREIDVQYRSQDSYLTSDILGIASVSGVSAYVYTPNGSAVSVIDTRNDTDFTSAEKTNLNNEYAKIYPNAVRLSDPTVRYNCHSYAWYSTSTSNHYWMNDPGKYMTDGSYTKSGVAPHYKIHYYGGDHSGIVTNCIGSTIVVTSKWGKLGVYQHNADYCPYGYYNGVSYYYR